MRRLRKFLSAGLFTVKEYFSKARPGNGKRERRGQENASCEEGQRARVGVTRSIIPGSHSARLSLKAGLTKSFASY